MTWVTTITRNLLVDHFRKSKQDRMTDSLDAPPSEHEDAMPLSDKIEDKGRPRIPLYRAARPGNWSTPHYRSFPRSCAKPSSCATCRIWITRKLPRY